MKQKNAAFGVKRSLWLAVALIPMAAAPTLSADVMTISGVINQSVADGTGPAANNPGLNDIVDGAAFTVKLNLPSPITAPGSYDLTGSGVLFSIVPAGATENAFDFTSLTIAQSGGIDVFSLFACLSSGSGCSQGNELAMNFFIVATDLNANTTAAEAIPGLLPLDLLEDDGVTDIHGSVTTYSYAPPAGAPEPSTILEFSTAVAAIVLSRVRWRSKTASR